MASQCKRLQCTIDRRGFRQELDSWRYKLIHCVGFESILESLLGPQLLEDLKLFKDLEPTTVSDWSFDENCPFCCLRREKVKEHLHVLSDEWLEDRPKPLSAKDQTAISRLEEQAEEFLHAVLCRKDAPNFSDPHIPVVAQEILQRMIRQFAAEYTSKSSPPQDSHSDQSLPDASSLSGAPPPSSSAAAATAAAASWPARSHNPVLSKLLMAVQDAPLDLTIRKPSALPSDQDGVLDLSIKKSRCSSGSSLPVRSPCLSPAAASLKGESPSLAVSKARELQSTSTLEQFMAKLCVQHQKQIVDAIGFLQSEVKALASSSTLQTGTLGIQGSACSSGKVCAVTPEKCNSKSENQDVSNSVQRSSAVKKDLENMASPKTSVTTGPVLDLRSLGLGTNHISVTNTTNAVDVNGSRHSDHAPLKMKIMASNVADGKKLSCVLNASLSSHSDSLEDREGHSNSSDRTDLHTARLNSSVKKHSQNHQPRQRDTHGPNNEMLSKKTFSPHRTASPDCPRTARKTIRTSSDNRSRDSACREIVDPDIGHCDIVFIDKPITECFKQRRRGMHPRRNARKSTRGHMYSEDVWELKTVRTLSGRGNCPTPMPELITLVTPKQVLSKPEGVPPIDMPFVGACRESLIQQMATEESSDSVLPGTADMVEVATSEVDVIVETSQTDQSQSKGSSLPPSPVRAQAQNEESDLRSEAEVEKHPAADSEVAESKESVTQSPPSVKSHNPEPTEDVEATAGQTVVAEAEEQPLKNVSVEDNELPLPVEQQQKSSPSAVDQVDEEEEDKKEEVLSKQSQRLQVGTQVEQFLEVTEESNCSGLAEGSVRNEPDSKASEAADAAMPLEADSDDDYDVSSKTLDSLLKELPPWRRKRGTVIALPKRLRQTETVVVGYVNGRPISASDRSLRRRSGNSGTSPVKISSKPSRIAASKAVVDPPVEPKVESDLLSKNPLDSVAEPPEAASDTQQVKEPSSVARTSTAAISPLKDKQMERQKKVQRGDDPTPLPSDQLADRSEVTRSKRQLRSTGQRTTSPPSVDVPSPEPAGSTATLATDQPSPLPPVTPPSVLAPPTAGDDQPQQNLVPEVVVESNTEEVLSVNAAGEETKTDENDGRLRVKQKLRSSKAALEDGKAEHQQLLIDRSSPSENHCPAETEASVLGMPLRSKRILRKDVETADVTARQKTDTATSEDVTVSSDDSVSVSERPTRMPLRSESNKPLMSSQAVVQSPATDGKKVALRSQRLATPSTSTASSAGRKSEVSSPGRGKPERTSKGQLRPPSLSASPEVSHSSAVRAATQRSEAPKQTANKFFQTLTGDESQHLISNLNIKFDKMQKGWLQIDKEGQPSAKYKNRADRQAAIWKSKRRVKKPKSMEHQKYSPVQMLFMKGFNLSSICRWFLESTETKSLVIVKKVNTRLPSETQLCFHSSSNSSASSQGVFPSLQAERLKKHLKKFAIASPVKSNPKSQKLIAKALEQEANAAKGKERREGPVGLSTSHSTKFSAPAGESQKSSGKTKIPASARILRKYSNIREKMQVQHTNSRLKDASKSLRSKSIKRLAASKSTAKSDVRPYLRVQKPPLTAGKPIKESAAKTEPRNTLSDKKPARNSAEERTRKGQSRALRDEGKKELAKRHSQRLGSTRTSEQKPTEAPKSKQATEAEKSDVEKPVASKVSAAKVQATDPSKPAAPVAEAAEDATESPPGSDPKAPGSPDQVLTRSQRKMETAATPSESPSPAAKKGTKSMHAQSASLKHVRNAEDSALTRSRAASLPRSAAKMATKRTQEPSAVPAKRTRTSLLK